MDAREAFLREMRACRSPQDVMHPDEEAFLAAIEANPGDDAPRLVFADYLEERGDVRAPWVRDAEIWAFMAPDAANPVARLLMPRVGYVPASNQDLLVRLGAAAVPNLEGALSDPFECVRNAAARALGKLGAVAATAVPSLIGKLCDSETSVSETAAEALTQIGTAAVPALIAYLAENDDVVSQLPVVRVLGRISSGAIAPAIAALGDEDWRVRKSAADLLNWNGAHAWRAVPALRGATRDANLWVRLAACGALGEIGNSAAGAIPELLDALRHDDLWLRMCAAKALGRIRPQSEEALSALTAALSDDDQGVARTSAEALGQIGPAGERALLHALRNRDTYYYAAEALGRLGPAQMPTLIGLLTDEDWRMRAGAARALGCIGPAAAEALPALMALVAVPTQDEHCYEVSSDVSEAIQRINAAE